MSLNKKQLIALTAEDQGLTINKATYFVDALLQNIADELKAGGSVDLHGFGKLSPVKREARTGRNPSTGEKIQIEAKVALKFKPAKALVDQVNS